MIKDDHVIAVPNLSADSRRVNVREVLDLSYDPDHGRTVFTLGGRIPDVERACLDLAAWATRHLDLRTHSGVHPRLGVVDVIPLVPYGEGEAELAVRELADELAETIDNGFGVPVYRYERADPQARSLPELRRFLRTTPHRSHPTAGVVCLGIRDPLVAFNVNFRGDLGDARRVAREARSEHVRALGFELASRRQVQVSMNLIAPGRAGPKAAFDRVLSLARHRQLELVDCEVVGLVPHPILGELAGLPLRSPVRSIEQAMAARGLST